MTLSEIAGSKEKCEELFLNGSLLNTIKNCAANITPGSEADEILNIVKIANRVVRFGADYDDPAFDRGDTAASVLELTFDMKEADDVPFMNAAAYLLNCGSYERMFEVCMKGHKRFPDSIEILDKAKQAAEFMQNTELEETVEKIKKVIFERNPDAMADDMNILVNNWKVDEAKELVYKYTDKGEVPTPRMYAKLFSIYTLGFKDERTDWFKERYLALIKAGAENYIKHADLAYQASIFFINNSSWQDSETVIKAYIASGAEVTALILNQLLSAAIISKDKTRIENALKEFNKTYEKDKNFFNEVNYTFANVSNCYAVFQDKNKALDYLKLAKNKSWDISYVKTMEDYKFISSDPDFLSLF